MIKGLVVHHAKKIISISLSHTNPVLNLSNNASLSMLHIRN